MPRAYDQIIVILDRFKVVRDNLNTLNANLQQVVIRVFIYHTNPLMLSEHRPWSIMSRLPNHE
jgi:hypothetical protein